MATAYSGGVVNSLVVAPVHEEQILLEVKFAEVDRTKLQQFGVNIFSTGAANTIGTVGTQQFSPPTLQTSGSSGERHDRNGYDKRYRSAQYLCLPA